MWYHGIHSRVHIWWCIHPCQLGTNVYVWCNWEYYWCNHGLCGSEELVIKSKPLTSNEIKNALGQNLFDQEETMKLLIYQISQHQYKETGNDELNAYHNGVADGCKFALMLLERTGD